MANSAVAARAAQAYGPGITLLPKIRDGTVKSILLRRWNNWSDAADAGGLLNWSGRQALAARTMLVDGEVFVRMLTGNDGMPRRGTAARTEPTGFRSKWGR